MNGIPKATAPCTTVVEDESAWVGTDIADERWIIHLDHDDIADIRATVSDFERSRTPLIESSRASFPFRTFGEKIATVREHVLHGRGFCVLRGLPVGREFSEDEAKIVHWAIGTHLGHAVPQNARGHLLGHVIDRGVTDPYRRSYESNKSHDYHTDQGDVVGLLCVRKARSGGVTTIVSAVAVHNVILREHPELLPHLYKLYRCDRMGEQIPGDEPWFESSSFIYLDGQLSSRPGIGSIRKAQRFPDVPRLTADEDEALEVLRSVPHRLEMAFEILLEPGDIQYLNNYWVLHGRSEYEDFDDEARRRYMVRLWLKVDSYSRALTPAYALRRDGIRLAPGVDPSLSLESEPFELAH
jgi:hypothetical protein